MQTCGGLSDARAHRQCLAQAVTRPNDTKIGNDFLTLADRAIDD
jgi:hypothetical protein